MIFPALLMGVILIVCGLLVVKYPMLIAGYNTMSKKERDKVDIKSLSRLMRKYLVAVGALTIVAGVIVDLLKVKAHYGVLILMSIVILGVIVMAISAQRTY